MLWPTLVSIYQPMSLENGHFLWLVHLLGTYSHYPFTMFRTLQFLKVILSLVFLNCILVFSVTLFQFSQCELRNTPADSYFFVTSINRITKV